MWIHLEKVLVIGYFCFLVVDSDSDNFESLKKVSKTKQNDTSKPTKTDAESPRSGSKPQVKPSSTQEKTGVRSPPKPVTPKSAPPPQPKKTPTSVFDYFGSGTIQRSDKKLVASTKRKAVSTDKQSCTASVSKPSGPGLCLPLQITFLQIKWLRTKLISSTANSGHRQSDQWWRNRQTSADGRRHGGRLIDIIIHWTNNQIWNSQLEDNY